jgi:hypothetical protein
MTVFGSVLRCRLLAILTAFLVRVEPPALHPDFPNSPSTGTREGGGYRTGLGRARTGEGAVPTDLAAPVFD